MGAKNECLLRRNSAVKLLVGVIKIGCYYLKDGFMSICDLESPDRLLYNINSQSLQIVTNICIDEIEEVLYRPDFRYALKHLGISFSFECRHKAKGKFRESVISHPTDWKWVSIPSGDDFKAAVKRLSHISARGSLPSKKFKKLK